MRPTYTDNEKHIDSTTKYYLVNIIFNAIDGDFELDYLFFNNAGKVKAYWYTGELKIPIGNRLYQECMEDPVSDSDWFINIKKVK